MSREKLNAAARHFLGRILPTATGKHFAELTNAEALLGAYRRYTGGAVSAFGQQITPEFVLKVKAGAVAVQGDNPSLGSDPVPADAASHPLIWMRFAGDAKVDDKATIQDLMGDLDTFAQKKFSLAGVEVNFTDDAPAPANSADWAQAIATNRSALPDNLATLTEVPTPFRSVAPTVPAFRLILSHFFTYDENGAYYPRWSGTGRQMPQNLTDAYKQKNVREFKLERDQIYVYMLAPKSLFTSQAAEAHDYYESVLRMDETSDPNNPFFPTLVHNAYRRIDGAAKFHDFIFFESEDGLGLQVSREVRAKISSALEEFLLSMPADQQARAQFFHDSTSVVEGTPPAIHLTATAQGPLSLPADVLSSEGSSGRVISMLAPVDKVLEIAALPQLQYLDLSGRPHKRMLNLVRPAIDFDTFRGKYAAGKQDGSGVIVGIIDSGIDGSHPAFNDASGNSRILAVWEQNDGAKGNANSPAKKHSTEKAYAKLDYGRERTGADVRGATDDTEGHGTHVAGIAAGAEVNTDGTMPRGIASRANIIAVKAIGANQGNPIDGLRYIFQKAKELNMPCVVNMSFGHHDHSHDGTDDLSRDLTDQLRDPATKTYLKGRVLVAAAGNERSDPIHVRRDLASKASTTFRYKVNKLAGSNPSAVDLVTIWVRPLAAGGAKPNIRVAVQHVPTGWTSVASTPSTKGTPVAVPGMNAALVLVYGDKDIHNGDYNVRVAFVSTAPGSPTPPLPAEEWRIIFTNDSTTALELHAWAAQPRALGGFEGTTNLDDSTFKVGSPGAARDVITVAASTTRTGWSDIDTTAHTISEDIGDVTSFSSPGPLRTCSDRLLDLFFLTLNLTHPALDTTAPGCLTQSARAKSVPITFPATAPPTDMRRYFRAMTMNNTSWLMQGTSMASPVVTGLVACMLAGEPDLTQEDSRTRVRNAGKLPAKTKLDPAHANEDAWGPGLVNAPALRP
jgi:subtilisin family serine protease